MDFGKWLKNRIKNVFIREMYMYDYLERYDINIEKTNRRFLENQKKNIHWTGERKYCSLVAETEHYRFYRYLGYEDGSGGYILRQNKKKPWRVINFGANSGSAHSVCVYKNHLITAYSEIHDIHVWLDIQNIKNGRRCKYWFPCDAYEIPAGKEGEPFVCCDIHGDVYVENDQLIVEVCRRRREIRKSGTPIGEDIDYKIVAYYDECSFNFSQVFPVWYLEEEKGDAIAALKACDFSDIIPTHA